MDIDFNELDPHRRQGHPTLGLQASPVVDGDALADLAPISLSASFPHSSDCRGPFFSTSGIRLRPQMIYLCGANIMSGPTGNYINTNRCPD